MSLTKKFSALLGIPDRVEQGLQLLEAVIKGDEEAVAALVGAGAPVDVRAPAGMSCPAGATPLLIAANAGHLSIARLLLDNGADVMARTPQLKWTSLHKAAAGGHAAVAELLLARGADVNAETVDRGMTTLQMAVAHKRPAVTAVLVAAGADKDQLSSVCGRPLHAAVRWGDVQSAEILIKAGAKLDAPKDFRQGSPLGMACSYGPSKLDIAIGDKLSDHDAEVAKSRLHSNQLKIIEMLIAADADIEEKDQHLDTPLHVAIRAENLSAAGLLVAAGADLQAKNNGGITAMDMAKNISPPMAALLEETQKRAEARRVAAEAEKEKAVRKAAITLPKGLTPAAPLRLSRGAKPRQG